MWVVKVEIGVNGKRQLRMLGLGSCVFKHGWNMVASFQEYEDYGRGFLRMVGLESCVLKHKGLGSWFLKHEGSRVLVFEAWGD